MILAKERMTRTLASSWFSVKPAKSGSTDFAWDMSLKISYMKTTTTVNNADPISTQTFSS
jgi:hypothetical protein